jgi:UDP-glucose 4-epimerase
VIDDESTGSIENLSAIIDHPRLSYTKGTVADEELVARLVQGKDEVYHLAAAVGVRLIAQRPIHTIETNIYTTELLLRQLGRRIERGETVKLFLASTSEVYGKNPKPLWSEEDDIVLGATTRPRWSYGASKAIDEFLALAYWRERRLPTVVGRFFNVVGPRQTGAYGMVLPRLIDAALDGRPLEVHDDGLQQRCFAHVSDVVRMVLGLMDCPEAVGGVCNIGSDQPVSILELARRVIAAVEKRAGASGQWPVPSGRKAGRAAAELPSPGTDRKLVGGRVAGGEGDQPPMHSALTLTLSQGKRGQNPDSRIPESRTPNPPIKFITYKEAYGEDFEDCRCRVPELGKLRRLTGMTARYSLDEIIAELIDWRLAMRGK